MRLLVPLDGTPFAESALPLARSIARRADAELVLVHAYEPPAAVGEWPGAAFGDPQTLHEIRRAAQDYLDDVVARTGAGRGVLLDGAPATAIHDAALEMDADLVVMASHGRGGVARFVFGSTAESVVREGGVPVLVVPRSEAQLHDEAAADPGARVDTREAPLPRHLLIALDGSPEAETILAPAFALARLLGSEVTLVTVRDPGRDRAALLLPTSVLDTSRSDERVLADEGEPPPDERAYLDAVARRLAADGWRAATRVLDGHPVVEQLLRGVQELGADWVAMSTHGRGLWGRLVEGSVAEAVLERVFMPVLLLRPIVTESDRAGES
jgi:nucleotide-binding universal stress UspA family protein